MRLISSSTQKKPEDWTVPGSSYLTPACGISVREKHYLRVNLCAVRPVHHRLVETTFGGTSLPEMSHAATDVFIILPRKFSLFNFFNTFPQLYFVTEDVNYLLPGFFVSMRGIINQSLLFLLHISATRLFKVLYITKTQNHRTHSQQLRLYI